MSNDHEEIQQLKKDVEHLEEQVGELKEDFLGMMVSVQRTTDGARKGIGHLERAVKLMIDVMEARETRDLELIGRKA